MKVIGLMSGTSADGVDAALVDIRGSGHDLKIRLLGFHTVPFPPSLRARILRAMIHGTVADVCHLNAAMGEWFARAALKLMRRVGVPPGRVALIGSHGQTLHHLPAPTSEPTIGKLRSTLQIGAPSIIAERTGIATVADFRARDVAAGGEGAPLTPYLHYLLFGRSSRARVIVNIGGISNITHLPAGGTLDSVRAFDTGPGNMVIDGVMRYVSQGRLLFDRGGRLARAGVPHEELLRTLLQHPFLKRRPPKSTGREEFGEQFLDLVLRQGKLLGLPDADLVATTTAYTARTIAGAAKVIPGRVDEVLLCGGGSRNVTMVNMLRSAWADQTGRTIPVKRVEDYGWDGRALEAVAFAVFAYQAVRAIPCNLPKVTGAKRAVVLGAITPARPKRAETRSYPGTPSHPKR